MSQVKARGILRHRFHGTYSAFIILEFADAQSASDACQTLGAPWEASQKHPQCLFFSGDSETLEKLKPQFKEKYFFKIIPCGRADCKHQCKDADIDSMNHSVDIGPQFEISIEVVPSEQKALFK